MIAPSLVCSESVLLAGFLIGVGLAAMLGLIALLRQNRLNSVLDALIALRDSLNPIGNALRADLGWRLLALPAIASTGRC